METVRERIIQAIQRNLQEIRVSSGYNSDCGKLVLRASLALPVEKLPAVGFTPQPDEPREKKYGHDLLTMPVTITASALYRDDPDIENQAEEISRLGEAILGDVRQAMGLNIEPGKRADYQGGGIEDYPEIREGEKAVQVTVLYHVEYETEINDPYRTK